MRPGHVLLLALLIWLPAAFLRPPTRQQELRVLVTARNQLEAGNPLHFEFQEQPRYRKPPMAYWVAATGMRLANRTDSAAIARLPFLAFAMLGLWFFMRLAGPAGSDAALLLVFSYGFWAYAPLAETDFLQLTGILAALLGWRVRSGALSGAGMAFALLSKGPGGALIPLLTFLPLQFVDPRRWTYWLQALALPLATAATWLLFLFSDPVARAALQRELSATFVDTAHDNPWFYFLYTLPLLFLPSLFLLIRHKGQTPAKSKSNSLDKGLSPDTRLAGFWFGVTLLLLTLTVSKQRHYGLLLMPPAAWLAALHLTRDRPLLSWKPATALALAAGLLPLPFYLTSEESRNTAFLEEARESVDNAPLLHVVGINSARFDFHLGRHVHNTDSVHTALRRAAPDDAIVVVKKQEHWTENDPATAPILEADDEYWIRRVYRAP